MELESQSAINPRHKSRLIKADQPSIAWIKFITPSSSFGPSLECPTLESAQISWISPLNASLIFLDPTLVIGPTGTCNESLNVYWFSSIILLFTIKSKRPTTNIPHILMSKQLTTKFFKKKLSIVVDGLSYSDVDVRFISFNFLVV